MIFTTENILLIGSILLFVSIIIGKTGYKYGIPSLLMFLIVGMAFGCDGFGLQFDNMAIAQFIGMVSLCIILFAGGMDTQVKDIKPILAEGITLSTLGVILTSATTGLFIYLITQATWSNIQFSLAISFLAASVMASTDSASVFAILSSKNTHLKNNIKPILELESGSNDPMAYMLTIMLIQIISSSQVNGWSMLLLFIKQFSFGGIVGAIMGICSVMALQRIKLDHKSLHPIMLLSLVFFCFTITETIGGNGYLAVYLAGMIIGNNKMIFKKEIHSFLNGLSWLCQIVMFLCLGLLVNPHELRHISVEAMIIGVFLIFIARPLSINICLLPFYKKLDIKSRLFISWVGLKGAVPIIFATYPIIYNIDGAKQIFNIVFFITILSLIIQGGTMNKLSRLLNLNLPYEEKSDYFGFELPEDFEGKLSELEIKQEHIENGCTLKELQLPRNNLVIIIKRNEEYIIPNGMSQLKIGDKLLVISNE